MPTPNEATPPTPPPVPLQTAPVAAPKYLDYRGYLLLSDAASVVLLIAAAETNNPASEALAYSGLGTYALGAPTVHLLNDQPRRAAASLGLRVGLPLVLAAGGFGVVAAGCRGSNSLGCAVSELSLGTLGFFTGVLGAVLVDDIVLGKVRLDQPSAPSTQRAAAPPSTGRQRQASLRVSVSPFLAPRAQGGGMMLVGAF
jgi:hypothetical protein